MMALCGAITPAAQNINLCRGSEIKADRKDSYIWKLQHMPSGNETEHFRQANSVITVNSTAGNCD